MKAEVADVMARAEAADAAEIPDGMSIPDELGRREERLRKLAEARANPRVEEPGGRRGPRSAMRASWPNMKPKWRRAKPEKRPRARSPAAGSRGRRPKDRCRTTKSI